MAHVNVPEIQIQSTQREVVIQHTELFHIETESEPWSWCNLVTSMVSVLFCFGLGFIATVLSILAYVDHNAKQFQRSSAKRKAAYGLSIAGIVVSIIILICWLSIVFTIPRRVY